MDTDLGNVDASFWGNHTGDYSGYSGSVAGLGDVNGDGYDDILIGAYGDNDAGRLAGQTYLILGKATGWYMDTDLSASDASFWGEGEGDRSGYSVAGAGDVNGDGYDEILIGAKSNDECVNEAGQTYLILGKATGWMMDTDLSASDASFRGEDAGDHSGTSVAIAGDVNGDGYDDILIGAYGDAYTGSTIGRTYLIFGKATGWDMDTDLSTSNASFLGEEKGECSGSTVTGAGDVNGDGYDDILIGAWRDDEGGDYSGQTYLIFGKAFGWAMDTDLSKSDASFLGEDAGDGAGNSIASAGDVNRDGFDDFLIGAWHDEEGGEKAGQTYLLLGKSSGWKMDTNLSASDASFRGEDRLDYSGSSIAGVGDVNGDGYDDILIGADRNRDSGLEAGQTYLIFLDHNSEPILYDDNYFPGNTSTNFTFSIMYQDIEGDKPVNVSLAIDGHCYPMIRNKSDPCDFQKGVRYFYTMNLTEGNHHYYYYVSDGNAGIRFPLDGNLIMPQDTDDDGLWDPIDPDRDGDNVPNVDDAFPDDPYRWKSDTNDTVTNPGRHRSISKWIGLVILVFVGAMIALTTYVVRKKRIEKSNQSETDDLGRT